MILKLTHFINLSWHYQCRHNLAFPSNFRLNADLTSGFLIKEDYLLFLTFFTYFYVKYAKKKVIDIVLDKNGGWSFYYKRQIFVQNFEPIIEEMHFEQNILRISRMLSKNPKKGFFSSRASDAKRHFNQALQAPSYLHGFLKNPFII
ncbi:hypothetical protein BpHYR1_041757 [Brachionus plicatilis]|uniref:Uncharacterized protein n=1 Tax=Brachionus plicatilis TaxID=10195 RepID=A0A3M7RVV9_BRAPC|nr:hypothetical protein BpHYR1_041757 [Brachionus plicatilis]